MKINAAGLNVSGSLNPNWRGGALLKKCAVCSKQYLVSRAQEKSKYCSMQCVGVSQRGVNNRKSLPRISLKFCEICGNSYSVPSSHANRHHCCSMSCSHKRRALAVRGELNPNWVGGLSRFPYPWNFNFISKTIIERDGGVCNNPLCDGLDLRMTTHHINYVKQDCSAWNLICLCSACNSSANFGREWWQFFCSMILSERAF